MAEICRMTLMGPSGKVQPKLLRLGPWTKPEWRRIVIELEVGSEKWPDWDAVNLCLTAMKDLLKMSEGVLSDPVVQALQTHVNVVSLESFRGPR